MFIAERNFILYLLFVPLARFDDTKYRPDEKFNKSSPHFISHFKLNYTRANTSLIKHAALIQRIKLHHTQIHYIHEVGVSIFNCTHYNREDSHKKIGQTILPRVVKPRAYTRITNKSRAAWHSKRERTDCSVSRLGLRRCVRSLRISRSLPISCVQTMHRIHARSVCGSRAFVVYCCSAMGYRFRALALFARWHFFFANSRRSVYRILMI